MTAMQISATELLSQQGSVAGQWPFTAAVEAQYGLPRLLLTAIGSRETECRNEYGDAGPRNATTWGHRLGPYPNGCWAVGVWQRDAGTNWTLYDPTLIGDVPRQAALAAAELAAGIAAFPGDLKAACAAYNAGQGGARSGLRDHHDPDWFTTGKNYGGDVTARLAWLQAHIPPAPAPTPVLEDDMAALVVFPNDPKKREFALTADRAYWLPNAAVRADLQNAGQLGKAVVTVGQQTLETVTPGVTK